MERMTTGFTTRVASSALHSDTNARHHKMHGGEAEDEAGDDEYEEYGDEYDYAEEDGGDERMSDVTQTTVKQEADMQTVFSSSHSASDNSNTANVSTNNTNNANNANNTQTTAGPVKKKRLAQACDNCRRRKVKCDGIRPSCNKCIQLRINCTYQPRNQKRKQRQGYIEKLENRLMEMERLLKSHAEAAAMAAAMSAGPGPANSLSDPMLVSQLAQISDSAGLAPLGNNLYNAAAAAASTTSPTQDLFMQQAMLNMLQDFNAPPPDLDLRLASIPGILGNNMMSGLSQSRLSPATSLGMAVDTQPMSMSPPPPQNLTPATSGFPASPASHSTTPVPGLPVDLNPLLAAWMTEAPQAVTSSLTVDPNTLSMLNASSQAAAASADLLLLNPHAASTSKPSLMSHSPSPSVSATSSSSPSISAATLPPASVRADPTRYPTTPVPNTAPIGNATYLPPVPDDLLKHLLSLFFTFCYPLGPMIHPPTFYKQLSARRISPLLLWTMCANSARYSDHPTLQANQLLASGEFFAQRAKEHLVASQSTPKVHGVQAVLFLGIFEYAQGRASTAWVYMGMATRMAQSLKLHRLDDPNLASRQQDQETDWVTQETKRRTWWVCYLVDRMGSLAAGVPASIDQRDIAVSLPSADPDWEVGANPQEHPNTVLNASETLAFLDMALNAKFSLPEDRLFSRYAYMLQLCSLMGRVNQFVIRPRFGVITKEENEEFERLDRMLTAWPQNLPPSLRFTVDMTRRRPTGEYRYSTHAMCLNIFHLVTVALLHRARYRSLTGRQADPVAASAGSNAPVGSGAQVATDVASGSPNLIDAATGSSKASLADKSLLRCVEAALNVAQIVKHGLGHVSARCHVLQPFCYLTCGVILVRCLDRNAKVDPSLRAAAHESFLVMLHGLRDCRPYWRLAENYLAILTDLASKLLPATQLPPVTVSASSAAATS